MSSRPTSASMLSMLPQPIQPIPGDSFNDRILLLLAAVATTDDMLTYREYQLVQEAAQAIFGERALHAELQAKLHYALLNPPSDPADIARDMANQADAQKVSSTFVDTMLKALSRIGGQEERIDEKARSLVNDIEWAFRKSRLERSAGRGIGLGLNVGESLGELYRKATNVLPSRKEIAGWFAPETSQFNADMERFANSLDRIAWTLDDMDLREELYIFRKMLRRQPFKIVIVGERKRGKSSLINAIIGQELSPVRESTPETATVVEFKYAHAPDYSVRFLDSSQFARLEDYLENEQDNLLLTRKIEHIRKGVSDGTFIPGKLLSGITCWDDLSDYISLEGRFSGFVARVSVGLPLDTLRAGVVLVDTPGLNDTDQFHDYLSYEESLEADCVIFVMDARDPGSNSELSLLRKLARSGRTVSIIGVLTNIDRLNSAASLEAAREPCGAKPAGAPAMWNSPVSWPSIPGRPSRNAAGEVPPSRKRCPKCRVPCPAAESLSSSLPSCGKSWTGMRAKRHTATKSRKPTPGLPTPPANGSASMCRSTANPCRTPNCSVCWTRTPNSFPPPPSPRWSRPGRS